MKTFTNPIVCCSHSVFIKCLIFIKFLDFIVFQHWNFYRKTTFKFYTDTLFRWGRNAYVTLWQIYSGYYRPIFLSELSEFCRRYYKKIFGLLFSWTRCICKVTCEHVVASYTRERQEKRTWLRRSASCRQCLSSGRCHTALKSYRSVYNSSCCISLAGST